MDLVIRVLPYALPPLLGAVIGYVTNALAIRMLFRPLTEKRLLGIRIPLTPGIIPRQRHRLAHSIARMVSTRLLTEDVLLSRLHDPQFEETLQASVARFTGEILYGREDAEESAAEPSAPQAGRGEGDADQQARAGIIQAAEGILGSFFHSDAFADMVHRVAQSVTEGALSQRTDAVLPDPERLGELTKSMVSAITGGPAAPAAELAVQRWVASHVEADTPLVTIIGHGSVERIVGMIPGLYEPIFEAMLSFLREPATRRELSVRGRELLKRVLERLNLFQRFLVSAAQYDRNLNEKMPAIVDDAIRSVERAGRDLNNRDRLVRSVQDRVRELAATGVATLLERFGLRADRLVTRVFALSVEMLSREDVRERISHAAVAFVDKHRDRTLGEILADIFGWDDEELPERIVAVADRWVARSGNADRLAERVTEFVMRYFGRAEREPLARLLPLTDDQKAHVDRFLTGRLVQLVERRVPEIIAGLDVYTMVVERIDGLDIESVEQLLLMVIARHLKWINLFGALLGSLIGGAQVVIGILT